MDNILNNPNVKILRDKTITNIEKYKKDNKKDHKKDVKKKMCIIS